MDRRSQAFVDTAGGHPPARRDWAEGEALMKNMFSISSCVCFIALVIPAPLKAMNLPEELLLRCNLKQSTFMESGGKVDHHEMQLTEDYRLKDGLLLLTRSPRPIGTDCKLVDNEITCLLAIVTLTKDKPSIPGIRSGAEKRESVIRIRQATGEFRSNLRITSFPDDNLRAKPSITTDVTKIGTCKSIGKPLF